MWKKWLYNSGIFNTGKIYKDSIRSFFSIIRSLGRLSSPRSTECGCKWNINWKAFQSVWFSFLSSDFKYTLYSVVPFNNITIGRTIQQPKEVWQWLIDIINNDHLHLMAIHQEARLVPCSLGRPWVAVLNRSTEMLLLFAAWLIYFKWLFVKQN